LTFFLEVLEAVEDDGDEDGFVADEEVGLVEDWVEDGPAAKRRTGELREAAAAVRGRRARVLLNEEEEERVRREKPFAVRDKNDIVMMFMN